MPESNPLQNFGEFNRTPYGSPGGGIVAAWGNMVERNRQIKDWDSVANSLYKAMTPAEGMDGSVESHPLGDPLAWKNASAKDRIRKVKGVLEASVLKSAMAENAAVPTQIRQREEGANVLMNERYMNILRDSTAINAANRGQADEDAGMAALPQFAESLANAPGTNRLQDVAAAMKAAPNVGRLRGNTMASQILERAMSGGGEGATSYMPESFEVGGLKGIVSPRTGSIHVQGGGQGNSFEERLQLLDRKGLLDEKRTLISALGKTFIPADKQYYQAQIDAIEAKLNPSASSASQPASRGGQANVTQEGYAKLKKGDTYWWNGKQLTKQ